MNFGAAFQTCCLLPFLYIKKIKIMQQLSIFFISPIVLNAQVKPEHSILI